MDDKSDIVIVLPNHLSFFNDFDGDLPETDSVKVINSTERTVLLSNVEVLHVRNHPAEKSGAAYFSPDWSAGNSVVLQPGFEAQIAGTCSPTTELRSALLVITTSHPKFTQLEVSLTGKHFITSGGFEPTVFHPFFLALRASPAPSPEHPRVRSLELWKGCG